MSETILPEKLSQAAEKNPALKWKRRTRKIINRVPQLLRLQKNDPRDFEPLLVSLGPYHHGKTELQSTENFKIKTLEMFASETGKDVYFFYCKVFELVNFARSCYVEGSTDEYDDQSFTQMMLLDACFIINFIVLHHDEDRLEITGVHLGDLVYAVLWRDLLLLENQIPFQVLKKLVFLGYGEDAGQHMLSSFLGVNILGICRQDFKLSSCMDDEQPFHILDAYWLVIVSDQSHQSRSSSAQNIGLLCSKYIGTDPIAHLRKSFKRISSLMSSVSSRKKDGIEEGRDEHQWLKIVKKYIHSYSCVTDLKAKGIQFRPQHGHSIKGMKFKSGYFNAHVEVPSLYIFEYTKAVLSNMIAHELCRTPYRCLAAYIDFITSLIDTGKDVKELREKKILFTTLKSDEEVASVCRQINLLGWKNGNVFLDIKEEIQAHYDNHAKTWLAELHYTYFRTPWTVVALLAATSLLVLTFLQTYYTM